MHRCVECGHAWHLEIFLKIKRVKELKFIPKYFIPGHLCMMCKLFHCHILGLVFLARRATGRFIWQCFSSKKYNDERLERYSSKPKTSTLKTVKKYIKSMLLILNPFACQLWMCFFKISCHSYVQLSLCLCDLFQADFLSDWTQRRLLSSKHILGLMAPATLSRLVKKV